MRSWPYAEPWYPLSDWRRRNSRQCVEPTEVILSGGGVRGLRALSRRVVLIQSSSAVRSRCCSRSMRYERPTFLSGITSQGIALLSQVKGCQAVSAAYNPTIWLCCRHTAGRRSDSESLEARGTQAGRFLARRLCNMGTACCVSNPVIEMLARRQKPDILEAHAGQRAERLCTSQGSTAPQTCQVTGSSSCMLSTAAVSAAEPR